MEERSFRELKSPIRRLGSTRKLLAFNNIRFQLSEQIRCLDNRMEIQMSIISEIQDFFKRKAEVELEYSRSLDKLVKNLQLRHKEQKQKREQWSIFSTYSCWKELLKQTTSSSKDHLTISEIYSTYLTICLNQIIEDSQRIYKRCREISCEAHEEILRVLQELYTTMKTYQTYQVDYRQAEIKLSSALIQQKKIEQSISQEKLDKSKKYRLVIKEVQKRRNKYTDAKLKALKAKNEYCLCLEASNMNIKKYFLEDIPDLINHIDFGFHDCVRRAIMMHVTSISGRHNSEKLSVESLLNCMNSFNSYCDKRRFLESNLSAFVIPKKLEFQGSKIEDINEQDIKTILHHDMDNRLNQLQNRIASLQAEIEEIWKTLQTAEISIFEMFNEKDYDCSSYFDNGTVVSTTKTPDCLSNKLRANKQETEDFYLTKFQEFLTNTTRISRLEAKEDYIRRSLVELGVEETTAYKTIEKMPRRKKMGRSQTSGQPKLFGGSLEDYLDTTKQEIPLILKSCIRVINLYGLHHQGIFRVSGSQVEINNFREGFERGEDPLAEVNDASDINSVAGVLKLYLRELREPLFPIIYFEQFMELAQIESKSDFIEKMKDLVKSLPKSVTVVMRYLFAFLNHLSEFSDENMMDTYNLAICFGPTLVPVPEDKDQVQYQNLINELIKNIIIFYDEIFSNDGGVIYEKYISEHYDDNDVVDCLSDNTHEDIELEVYPSEDDLEMLEGHVLFNFNARSDKEISLKKGEIVHLYSQVSNDWWRGSLNGKEGLIPDKYISMKIKDEEKEKIDLCDTSIEKKPSNNDEDNMNYSSSSQSFEVDKISEKNLPSDQCAEIVENLTFSDKLEKWKEFVNNDNINKKGSIHTPDLVVDLPLNNNLLNNCVINDKLPSPSSPPSSDSDSDSSEILSPADCFAKQKQSTLKKNSRKSTKIDEYIFESNSCSEQNNHDNTISNSVFTDDNNEQIISSLKTIDKNDSEILAESSEQSKQQLVEQKVKPALFKKPKLPFVKQSDLKFLKKS